MRPNRLLAPVLVLLVLPVLAPAAGADDYSLEAFLKRESAWKGHGVGSSITETTTVQLPKVPNVPNMPNIPGLPKGGKMVTTQKTTLLKITPTGYVLQVAETSMGRTTTRKETEPKSFDLEPRLTDAGEGSVTVEGKSYTCAVKTVANMGELMGDAMEAASGGRKMPVSPSMGKGKVFVHAKLGVLRLEGTMSVMGQQGTSVWQVSRLSVAHRIGARTVTCREITLTNSMTMGTSTITMLVAPGVPGGAVRTEVASRMMGRKTSSVSEITAWEKKPLTAVTAK